MNLPLTEKGGNPIHTPFAPEKKSPGVFDSTQSLPLAIGG
jgi:hypothetical protein